MNKHALVVPVCFVVACFVSVAPAGAADAKKAAEATYVNPVDRMLKDFAAAVSALDAQKGEALFLPPDDTPDGKNRQGHLREMKKDWGKARERGQQMTVEFRNVVIVVRADMSMGGHEAEREPIPVELKVALTKEGCEIVAMKYLKQ